MIHIKKNSNNDENADLIFATIRESTEEQNQAHRFIV